MMKRVFSLALMFTAAPLFAATYYASPSGTSSAAGTEADPYDIATAIAKLGNNTYDDVYLLPGTYKVGSASLAAIDYYARLIGKGATRDDVVLDFEGAGTALKVQTGASVCNLTISNFVNCSAMEIINYNGYGELIVSNCVIRSGSGTKPGMTMSGAGPILVVDSVIRDIDGNIPGGGYGVGVNCSAAGACFRRCTFANNTYTGWVGLGGAAGYFSAAALVENCIVSNNSATGYGGGFHTTTGMRIKDTLFIGNSSSANGGGAIYSQSGANNTNFIVGCTFIDNRTTVSSVKGGAIFAGFYNTLVSNCSFTANASLSNGGAIHCYDSATDKTIGIEIVGCGFTNNTASSGGSAITIGRRGAERIEPPFNIRNCHFKGNTNSANATGGGIQLYGFVQANVEDCDFEDNQAGVSSGEGGAIGRTNDAWNEAMARAVCRRCRFVNNRAAVGAAIAATASLYDCDFFGNIATNSNANGCNAIVYLYGKRLVAKEYLDEAFTNFVSGCHFEGNVVYGTTMGIMAPFGDFRCYDTTFSNNVGYTSHITGGWSVNLRAPTYFEADRRHVRTFANSLSSVPPALDPGDVPTQLASGFEPGEPAAVVDTVATRGGGLRRVSDNRCGAVERADAHSGRYAVRLAGVSDDPAYSFVYQTLFKQPVFVMPDTVLTYWFKPLNESGRGTGIDLLFADGKTLRQSGSVDRDGISTFPGVKRGRLDAWTQITVPLGKFAGNTIVTVMAAYDTRKGGGRFESLFDDLRIAPELSPAARQVRLEPAGGRVARGTQIRLVKEPSVRVRYTLDGSAPKADSPEYKEPFTLTQRGVVEVQVAPLTLDGALSEQVLGALYEVE